MDKFLYPELSEAKIDDGQDKDDNYEPTSVHCPATNSKKNKKEIRSEEKFSEGGRYKRFY